MNLDPNRGFSRKGHKLLQLVNLLFQIFVRFQSRAITNKKERVVHSLVYASQKKKERKKRRPVIPKSIYELDFSLFSVSTGVLINMRLFC